MKALGRPVIILNKFEHARELMEKRSSTYSDRPRMVYIVEMYDNLYLYGKSSANNTDCLFI